METPNQDLERKREKNRQAAAKYRAKNPGKLAERMRKWRADNPEKAKEHGRNWRLKKLTTGSPDDIAAFRRQEAKHARDTHQRCKNQVFAAYGGCVCACCKESEKSFLSIDHINNDGAKMRREKLYSGNGTGFYQWLRKNNFPAGFQVLCMNCQFGKKKHGICPHQGTA